MTRLLVKIGGAQLHAEASRAELARAIAAAVAAGHEVVVVHGGGDQIRAMTQRLGIPDRYHRGLRVTDAATAEVALMVLGGQVNRHLVQALQEAGLRAVGLTGADGGSFSARRHPSAGEEDLGFVGQVHGTDRRLVDELLRAGIVPVLATVAPLAAGEEGDASHFYNINADHAAGPLARALGADVLLFLTDVPGVLSHAGACFETLTPQSCATLEADGVVHGGMIPKVQAALLAAAAHPTGTVKIAPAAGPDAVLRALDASVGTSFRPD